MTFDDIDKKILMLLREDARKPLSQIAKEINRSRTAVQARVAKLESTGAILGYTTLSPETPKSKMSAMVTVYLHERLQPGSIINLLSEFPEARFCHRISGDADLLVELWGGPHERIQEICKILWDHENVRLTETVFVMDTVLEKK